MISMLILVQFCVPNAQWAKQAETSEFGAKKDLLQGHAKRWVAHALKRPWITGKVSPKHFLKASKEGGWQGVCSAHGQSSDWLMVR